MPAQRHLVWELPWHLLGRQPLALPYLGVRENYFNYQLSDNDEAEENRVGYLFLLNSVVFKSALVAVPSVSESRHTSHFNDSHFAPFLHACT